MIKLIGGLLIVTASGLAGWKKAGLYSRRPRELRQLIAALQMLETDITYVATPLPEALARAAEQIGAPVSILLERIAGELQTGSGRPAREAWSESLQWYHQRSSLSDSDLSIVRGLGNSIGISDREDQGKHIRLAAEQLKAALTAAEEAAQKNVKMWNYVGLLGGLVIVLALY